MEAIGEDKIIVELSSDDMETLDIRYEDMDYSNIETRRVVWTLLDKAKQTLGRDIDPSGRLMIEAVPKADGGCLLYFSIDCRSKTIRPCSRTKLRRGKFCLVYEFNDFDKLIDCARLYKTNCKASATGSLYECDGVYRLVISTDCEPTELKNCFSEYGRYIGEGNLCVSFTRERWSLIEKDSALDHLMAV